MNISSFLFLDSADEAMVSNVFSIASNGLTFTFEVSGTFTGVSLKLEGKVDRDSEQWTTLSVVNIATSANVSDITSTGLYKVGVGGMYALRMNLVNIDSGSIKVVGKLIDARIYPSASAGSTPVVESKYISFYVDGELTVGTDVSNTPAPSDMTITEVFISSDVAPTGADLIIDINVSTLTDGVYGSPVSIYTTQANRPTLVIGKNGAIATLPDVVAISKYQKISVDIDQVGSTLAGENLSVMITCEV